MKNVRLLDCTLRDGGRIINCSFSDEEISDISTKLVKAGIDIIEIGFLRDARDIDYCGNSTFFTDINQMKPFIKRNDKNTIYTAFIDYGMFDFNSLKPRSDGSIDAIRFGFTKKNYKEYKEDIIECCMRIKEKGYMLFIQGVNSLSYSDRELLDVIELVNDVHPYSFGIVDTYGAMYIDDIDRLYSLIDRNMDKEICINFHSHNNYQLSFAFAQEVIKLAAVSERRVIIDGTLGGMGKVAGNLNLELIADYMTRRCGVYYDMDAIFDLLDQYIYRYAKKHKWGYSAASLMAGIYQSHPNNVIYLTEKFSLETKDIGKILSMIPQEERFRYDYDNIERLYIEYTSSKVFDGDIVEELKHEIEQRPVLVLVPGSSLISRGKEIERFINEQEPFVISVNFVSSLKRAYAFFGNEKSYARTKKKRNGRNIIITSNVKEDNNGNTKMVDYTGLIDREYKYFENSTMMLLRLLRRIKVSSIIIAGFDGFDLNLETNYLDKDFQNDRYVDRFGELNYEIKQMMDKYRKSIVGLCDLKFLTPSIFDESR